MDPITPIPTPAIESLSAIYEDHRKFHEENFLNPCSCYLCHLYIKTQTIDLTWEDPETIDLTQLIQRPSRIDFGISTSNIITYKRRQ